MNSHYNHRLTGYNLLIKGLSIEKHNNKMITCGDDGILAIWNINTNTLIKKLNLNSILIGIYFYKLDCVI